MSDVKNIKWRMCLCCCLLSTLWGGGRPLGGIMADNTWLGQFVGEWHCMTNRKTSVSYSEKSLSVQLFRMLGCTQKHN